MAWECLNANIQERLVLTNLSEPSSSFFPINRQEIQTENISPIVNHPGALKV